MGLEYFLKAWGFARKRVLLLRLEHENHNICFMKSWFSGDFVKSVKECMSAFCMRLLKSVCVCVDFMTVFVHTVGLSGCSTCVHTMADCNLFILKVSKCNRSKLISCRQLLCLITLFFTGCALKSYQLMTCKHEVYCCDSVAVAAASRAGRVLWFHSCLICLLRNYLTSNISAIRFFCSINI